MTKCHQFLQERRNRKGIRYEKRNYAKTQGQPARTVVPGLPGAAPLAVHEDKTVMRRKELTVAQLRCCPE